MGRRTRSRRAADAGRGRPGASRGYDGQHGAYGPVQVVRHARCLVDDQQAHTRARHGAFRHLPAAGVIQWFNDWKELGKQQLFSE